MLQNGDPMAVHLGFYGAVAYAVVKACVAIALFGICAIGFLFANLTALDRLIAFGAAVMLFGEFPFSDPIGYGTAAALVGWHWWRAGKRRAVTT